MAGASLTWAGEELKTLKANTDRWIEVQSRLAREASAWELEKEVLRQSILTLETSRETIRAGAEFHAGEARRLEKDNASAQERLAAMEATQAGLREKIEVFEGRVLALARRLPPPLRDRLQPFLAKVGTGRRDATGNLPVRLQNVVAILTLIDEFNGELNLSHAIREMENGEVVEVRMLFWGLGAGYAMDKTGSRAWVLAPGEDDWEWRPAGEHAAAIGQLFAVYDKRVDPMLVAAPFALEETEAQR